MGSSHLELIKQVQIRHIAVSPLATITNLEKLSISPLSTITQPNLQPRMIYDFTWSGLNNATAWLAPQQEMRFGNTLKCTTQSVFDENPALGPFYLRKVDLADAYMRLWVCMEDISFLTFLIPKKRSADTQLIRFHLALTMVYINISALFCVTTGTAADMSNNAILWRQPPRPTLSIQG